MSAPVFLSNVERLKRMRRSAGFLLLAMVALLGLCCVGQARWGWLEWPQAFAEAALVGGIADWFAVVALFRHPMGLRIPHTAVFKERQGEIARTMGTFVVANFLTRSVVAARLRHVDLVALGAGWLEGEANFLAERICRAVPTLLDSMDSEGIALLIQTRLRKQIEALPLAPLAGKLLGVLTAGGRHEVLLDEALGLAERLLLQHRGALEAGIRKEVPLPDYLLLPVFSLEDTKAMIAAWVAEKLVARMQDFLSAASRDRTHPVRAEFSARVHRFVADLQGSAEYLRKGEELKAELLSNAALRDYAEGIWKEIREALEKAAKENGGGLQCAVGGAIAVFARSLRTSGEDASAWNESLREWVCQFVETHRGAVGRLIEETVAGWDAQEMSRKIEEEIGADLQFVRINGTLIGGLVGLLIHALVMALR